MPTAAQGRARTPQGSRRALRKRGYGTSPEPTSVARGIQQVQQSQVDRRQLHASRVRAIQQPYEGYRSAQTRLRSLNQSLNDLYGQTASNLTKLSPYGTVSPSHSDILNDPKYKQLAKIYHRIAKDPGNAKAYIDNAAERGLIDEKPHNFTSVIGDLIPDTPGEIAATVATGGIGRIAKAGELGAVEGAAALGGRASRGVRDARDLVRGARAIGPGRIAKGTAAAGRIERKARDLGGAVAEHTPAPVKSAAETAVKGWRSKPGRVIQGTGRAVGRTASFPFRRPIKFAKYSALAQAPVIANDPSKGAQQFLESGGVAGSVLNKVGAAADAVLPGIAGHAAQDFIDLPAQLVPSVYLPAAGLVEAAQGRPDRINKLWDYYKKTGFLPHLVSGDLGGAAHAFGEHPVYSALELSGARAALGRTAGAVLRRAGSEAGSVERAPLDVGAGQAPKPRQHSPDVIAKAAQVLADRRRARKHGATEQGLGVSEHERNKILAERVDRIVAQEEGARRAGRGEQAVGAVESLKGAKLGRLHRGSKANISRDLGVSLAVQKILRSPQTFHEDINTFSKKLDEGHGQLHEALQKAKTNAERTDIRRKIKLNQEMHDQLEELNRKGDPEKIFAAAEPNAEALRQTDAQLADLGAIDPRQAEQARLMPAAHVHLDARHGVANETRAEIEKLRAQRDATTNLQLKRSLGGKINALAKRTQMIDRNGDALPPERAAAELRKAGVDPEKIGFVSQSPAATGPRSFYRSMFPDRAGIGNAKRTGAATEQGTFDPSFDAVVEQRVRGQGITDAVRGFDRTVSDLAVGGARYKNIREATQAAERVTEETGTPMRAVRLTPLHAKEAEIRRAEDIFNSLSDRNHAGMESVVHNLLDDSVHDGPGPAVIIPDAAYQRLRDHFQAATTTRKVAQVLSSAFKGIVLPTSPNWLLGNVIDVNTRALLSGTTLYGKNALLGKKLIRELEQTNPEMAKRIKAGLVPGSVYGAAEANRVFRDARQFAGTKLAPLATAFGVLRRSPGVKQVVNFYGKYRDAVFEMNAKFIEDQSFYALLGKQARREVRLTTGRWEKGLRVGDEAVRDLAKGLLDTPNQIRYAKSIEQTLGQWTANGPEMRAFLIDYAPFAMWARAATKFVFVTLPAHHPIKTALAATAAEMTQEERDALGLSVFADKPLPGNLQGSIPLGGGRLLSPQSISSFGFFADYQNSLATSIFPQFQSGLDALKGLDWTGKQLTHGDGTPLNQAERAVVALQTIGESYVPFLAMGKRIADKGFFQGALPRSVRPYDKRTVDYLRSLSGMQQISVPAKGSSSSSSGGGSSSSSGWRGGSSSSSSAGGWR